MKDWLKAIRFVLYQQTGKGPLISTQKKSIEINGQSISTEIYVRSNFSDRELNTLPCLIFLHGMSLQGNQDPRQINVCKALAAIGFRVLSPSFTEIEKTQIRADSVTKFVEYIQVVCNDEELCSKKKISLFAPSFSGSIALIAAAHESIREKISAICALGAFNNIEHCFEYLLFAENADPYARLIIMRNFLPLEYRRPYVSQALDYAIQDCWSNQTSAFLKYYLEKISTSERELVHDLLYNKFWLRENSNLLKAQFAHLTKFFDVANHAGHIRASVLLLHGDSDNVIPPTESMDLAKLFEKNKYRLVISPFLEHADPEIKPSLIIHLFKLFSGFSYFFHAAKTN